MSKKSKSNNISKSNITNNNNNNIGFSRHTSFTNSKLEINLKENDNNFKDLTQIDKFNFIKNCIKKAEEREKEETMEMNDLKLYEKTFLSKINELKLDIGETTRKIDEVKIAREEVERKLKNKKIFLEIKMGKLIVEDNNHKTIEEIQQINEQLENDIIEKNKEMEIIKKDIEQMSEQSLESHQNIEFLKKKE